MQQMSYKPRIVPPLDREFIPAALYGKAIGSIEESESVTLKIALETPDGSVSHHGIEVVPDQHPLSGDCTRFVERTFKFLLWQRGGSKIYVGGPRSIGEQIKRTYSASGERVFDASLMGTIYNHPLEVEVCSPYEIPDSREMRHDAGGHLNGCRIGFDLGASDIKIAAVQDGYPLLQEEIIWEPSSHSSPEYHYRHIMNALQMAASKLERVDAIGGSAAGIYVDKRVRVASLFRGIPDERYDEVRDLFVRIEEEMGVPLILANDGDVAALAAAMSSQATNVLGIALGSSEASGYVDSKGHITGWLNELAFAPIDYSPSAAVDEWSGDRGCGASYLSQQAAFRLAANAGIRLPQGVANAEKLLFLQEKLQRQEQRAVQIWESIGIYAGYAVAHYASFYDIELVLLLGRVTSGAGGEIILQALRRVLRSEFPIFAELLEVSLPDEQSRRFGQAMAAASLPFVA